MIRFLVVADTGVGQGPPPVLDVKKNSSSSLSPASIFEVVADDLQMLNQNLQSVSTFYLWEIQNVESFLNLDVTCNKMIP